GDTVAYGADRWTEEATSGLREIFGADEAFLVLNGSGANVLGLSLLLRRHEAVICAESAHINTDECGAPEQLVGTKLLTVPTADGKITPELIAEKLSGRGDDHRSQPGVVALTQATELGTCYTLAELRKIADFCHATHPNAMARLLAEGATAVPGVELVHPVQANAVFARLPQRHIAALQQDWTFHVWDEENNVVRWMTAFDTTQADVDAFLDDIRST